MSDIETLVADHYASEALLGAIDEGWEKARALGGASLLDALGAVDEFHMGGRVATDMICEQMDLAPGLRVVDVGCGLGGAARFMASRFGVAVEGVDLTPDYIEAGNELSRRVGLEDKVSLVVGSALDLPYGDAAFDRASLLHVGMNIADKARMFAEIARVTKPGGLLAVYEVMRTGEGAIEYPVAWAGSEATSFVGSIEDYAKALHDAGFDAGEPRIMRELALEFFARMKARMAESGPPPLGLHLVMGKDAPTKAANMASNIARGVIAPVLMMARRR